MELAIILRACRGHAHMRVHFKEVGDKLIANMCICVCSKCVSGRYCGEELLKCLVSGPWVLDELCLSLSLLVFSPERRGYFLQVTLFALSIFYCDNQKKRQ